MEIIVKRAHTHRKSSVCFSVICQTDSQIDRRTGRLVFFFFLLEKKNNKQKSPFLHKNTIQYNTMQLNAIQ